MLSGYLSHCYDVTISTCHSIFQRPAFVSMSLRAFRIFFRVRQNRNSGEFTLFPFLSISPIQHAAYDYTWWEMGCKYLILLTPSCGVFLKYIFHGWPELAQGINPNPHFNNWHNNANFISCILFPLPAYSTLGVFYISPKTTSTGTLCSGFVSRESQLRTANPGKILRV